MSQSQIGFSTARNRDKAVCSNVATFGQAELEWRVLDALHHNLMDQDALKNDLTTAKKNHADRAYQNSIGADTPKKKNGFLT